MHSTTIAVDLAKSVFEVAVSVRPGKVSLRRRPSRGQFSRFLAEQAPATVVMEACGTAHYWGREAGARGHRVVLLPPHAVRPYVLRNKTDGADAKGLLEAIRNDGVRPVPVKSVDQHVLAGLHRLRSAWMATRTARLNTLRGLLRELGFAIPVGARQVVPFVVALVSDADSRLPDALRAVLSETTREIRELEVRVHEVVLAREHDEGERSPHPTAHDPRRGPAYGDRARRLRGRRPALPVGTPLCELPRSDASGVVEWAAAAPGSDQ
jgi:transposase